MQTFRLFTEHENVTHAEPAEPSPIVGESRALREALHQAETVARTDCTVLILGETGTGKELIANAIHRASGKAGRLVKVNVASVPGTLLESELFGHERGAFTGALARRVGRFELAREGTLFLDEIGELPLELQPKLLRLLQEREYERLGSNQTLRVTARLVVATHRDLPSMVRAQEFREDLFYRLNVFPLRVPSLRERPEDIPLLAQSFAATYARRLGHPRPRLSLGTLSQLAKHPWPGNVRQLQNVIERAVILSGATGEPRVEMPEVDVVMSPSSREQEHTLDAVQRAHILNVLESTGWVIGGPRGAAAKLGMKRTTLNFRLKKLGISQEIRRDRWLSRNV